MFDPTPFERRIRPAHAWPVGPGIRANPGKALANENAPRAIIKGTGECTSGILSAETADHNPTDVFAPRLYEPPDEMEDKRWISGVEHWDC